MVRRWAGSLVRRRFTAGILAGFLIVVAAQWLINRTPVADWIVGPLLMDDTTGRADAIVVMGAGIINGCVPNNNGLRRVLYAARLWRDGRAPMVFFTGGSGPESCPVAVAMSQFARELGVPDSAMQVETASLNTHENGTRSAPLLDRLGAHRLLIVTDRLHMRRASGIFGRLGFEIERASVPIYEGHPNNVSMLYAGLREFAALGYYRTRGWLGPATQPRPVSHQGPGSGVNANVKHVNGPLVILGASYAGGWETPDLAGRPTINKGVDGQQSFEMLERFDRDVVAAQPRAVLLWGFINDIYRSAPDAIDATMRRTRESYVQMIAAARRNGIEPVVATEVSIRPVAGIKEAFAGWIGSLMGKQAYQDQINARVAEINAWLADYARKEGVLLLDFNAALRDDSGRRRAEFAKPDGSHITPAGYAALTAYARPILARHLAAERSGS